jgi:heme exporter protein CcmD
MANFFAMGGYAIFVWPAYAITALVLGAAIVLCLQAHARAKRSVRRLEEEGGDTEESQN